MNKQKPQVEECIIASVEVKGQRDFWALGHWLRKCMQDLGVDDGKSPEDKTVKCLEKKILRWPKGRWLSF